MTLLQAARIVRKLGLEHQIQYLVGRFHVQEPRAVVADSIRLRAHRMIVKASAADGIVIALAFCCPMDPDDSLEDACAKYAVAVHRHNLRTYGRVVGGRI